MIPTRNEAQNIEQLITRLERVLHDTPFEAIFVDDSDDETVAAIEAMQARATCDVRYVHRQAGERHDGLGGAVVVGLLEARAPSVVVMDADLQHPPELVPQLLREFARQNLDLVVASRYSGEGDAAEFGAVRASISRSFTSAARLLFPGSLRNVSDPMSGFFLVRKSALDIAKLRPQGFKILLEILVRTPRLRISEVGFHFGKRNAGESKASLREGLRYISHLFALRFNAGSAQFAKFMVVGLTGIAVNVALLALATGVFGIHYLLGAVLATQGSTAWNFALTEAWVFKGGQRSKNWGMRFVLFLVMNNAAFLLRGPMIVLMTAGLGIYYLISNLISLVALTAVRYVVADKLIWGREKKAAGNVFNYDIHGIITVQSDVWLPELERFMVQSTQARPNIRVQIGKVKADKAPATAANVRHTRYDEGLGPIGFAADITIGETTDIVASPILRHSPHVLYTNVVEPVLRWAFVEKGYALAHGACITVGDKAYLVTARTDTGKTTTMLRILDRHRRAADRVSFMSDDLTLVAPNGTVLTYPKPLTISHHTVRAINSAMLTWAERFALPFQSRVHSKSGRRFAFLLTYTKLPVATINTIVQYLVPPPKYHVQRLVSHAKVAQEATLAGMFVIERGGEGDVVLDGDEAFNTLMGNSEDAFGFPPYPTIKSFLYNANGRDLRVVEREIVAAALAGRPTLLLRSTTMDWAQRIGERLNGTSTRRTAAPEPQTVGELATELSA